MNILNQVDHDLISLMSVSPWKDHDLRLTKKWLSDGAIAGYDAGALFSYRQAKVTGIKELSEVLTSLEDDPLTAIVRAERKPIKDISDITRSGKTADKPEKAIPWDGVVRHWGECFNALPYHFILIDVDNFRPEGIDPVRDPEAAALQYISRVLPDEFQGVSFHWQLSSSAGHTDNVGVLKAHVWFWLKTTYTSRELKVWADELNRKLVKDISPPLEHKPVDTSPYKLNQFHYTANPLFDEGVTDPVPLRSCLYEGWLDDSVDLVIDVVLLLRASEAAEREKYGHDLADPKNKTGAIGAFHRVFSMDHLLANELADIFDRGSQDHRLTWSGSSKPNDEGAFITDDEEHIVIVNDSCSLEGPVNKFDLVRHFVYGYLDDGLDALELLDMTSRPSFHAAMQFIESLPEVQAELEVERAESLQVKIADRKSLVDSYLSRVKESTDEYSLELDLCYEMATDKSITPADRERLAKAVQGRVHALANSKPSIASVRQWLAPPSVAGGVELNDEDRPLLNIRNLEHVLTQLRATVRYNTMLKDDEILLPGHSFSLANAANASFARIISACADEGIQGTATIKLYLNAIADANLYNPVMTWIVSKPWDGVSRLQDIYDTLTVSKDHIPTRDLMLRKWLLSAVTVAVKPEGDMARGVLVLTGAQNKGKSRWVQSLAPLHGMVYEGHLLDPRDKDSVKLAISAWITELGELDATFRKADIAALKAFISKKVDKFRRPFAPLECSYPRQTVFAGTVNDTEYLKDPTGSTRFWTIQVLKVNHDHGLDMQQVWAEIYESMYLKGEQHWAGDEEMEAINTHNEAFTEVEPLKEILLTRFDWQAPASEWADCTVTEIAERLGLDKLNKSTTTKIGQILTAIGAPPSDSSNGVRLRRIPPLKPWEFVRA